MTHPNQKICSSKPIQVPKRKVNTIDLLPRFRIRPTPLRSKGTLTLHLFSLAFVELKQMTIGRAHQDYFHVIILLLCISITKLDLFLLCNIFNFVKYVLDIHLSVIRRLMFNFSNHLEIRHLSVLSSNSLIYPKA